MDEYVRVDFSPPRSSRHVGKSYVLTDGENEVRLPVSKTTLKLDGEMVVGADIPKFIAEDRGLVVSGEAHKAASKENMTRHDWFVLGATMAMLIRGDDIRDAVRGARKAAARLLDGEL